MRLKYWPSARTWLLLLVLSPSIAQAQALADDVYLGIFGGVVVPDPDRDAKSNINLQGLVGLPLGGIFAAEATIFGYQLNHKTDTDRDHTAGAAIDLHVGHRAGGHLFGVVGAGLLYETSRGQENVSPTVGGGLGIYLPAGPGTLLRIEGRYDSVFGDASVIPVNGDGRRDEFRLNLGFVFGTSVIPVAKPAAEVPAKQQEKMPKPAAIPVVDSDGDLVSDPLDLCYATPVGDKVDTRGCSIDSDGDRVNDGPDRCPMTMAGALVNVVGCAPDQLDADADRVSDARDVCPGTAAASAVNAEGCSIQQLDLDGDQVLNTADQCSDTSAGRRVDAVGCAILEGMIVHFETGSNDLSVADMAMLDDVAATMRVQPTLKLIAGGHSDENEGNTVPPGLSLKRAMAVRFYLEERQIGHGRVLARAFGTSKPLASDKTEEGRAQNRCVVLLVPKP